MRIEQEDNNPVDIFNNEIEYYMQEFCEIHEIGNLREVSQNVWNGMLIYVQNHVFKNTTKLKQVGCLDGHSNFQTCNAYDIDKVNALCDYYIYLCALYDKIVSILGFAKFTGINQDTIHDWHNNLNKFSTKGCEIYKKLTSEREESIVARLSTGKQNPVGLLGMLNHYDGWNMPGVSKETSTRKALDASQLPQLGSGSNEKAAELPVVEVENS